MPRPLLALVPVTALLLGMRPAVAQTLVPGGGPARSDCYGEFLAPAPNRGTSGIDCQDGDPACDLDRVANGTCALAVGVCVHQENLDRCVPRSVQRVRLRAKPRRIQRALPVPLPTPPPTPVSIATCGSDTVVSLPLRRDRRGRQRASKRITLRLVTTASGSPRQDKDRLRLRCVPNAGAGRCGANPAGGPGELRLVTAGTGTDLDLGWTGNAHNLGVVANAALRVCLADCGATATPQCTAREADSAAVNAPTFGAPAPLLAADVPVCIVTRFGAPPVAGVRADIDSGAAAGTLNLVAEFYRTSRTQVCPRCSGPAPGDVGLCDSGARRGRACVTAGSAQVPGADGDPAYALSPDCPPAGMAAGAVSLSVPLTTDVATLAGPDPCGAAQDDACGGACGATCTGSACVSTVNGQCLDVRGGLGQLCCTTDTARPCFATAGGAPLVRLGSATAPVPPFGDPSYPKVGGLTLVGVFCAPASGSALVDALVGLPGPGALVLPMAAAWL